MRDRTRDDEDDGWRVGEHRAVRRSHETMDPMAHRQQYLRLEAPLRPGNEARPMGSSVALLD